MGQKGFLEKLKETVFGPEQPRAAANKVTASPLERQTLALLDPKATPADAKKLRGIVRWLERCPSGLHDLDLIVEKRIGISFDMRDAGGGGYRRATNSIILSRMRTDAGTVATLVHEATHAREHFAGYGSNFDVQGREEYAQSVV